MILPIQQQKRNLYIRSRQSYSLSQPILIVKLEQLLLAQLNNVHLTVGDLASQLFLSERQFFRRIKQLTGSPPNEFIREVRLKKAYQLLQNKTYDNVKEIAFEVGYKRPDYFSKLFEKQYGVRPLSLLNK